MPPAKLGLIYGHTGLQRFIDTIGVPADQGAVPDRAQRRRPSEPSEIGLVHEVVDDDELEAAALSWPPRSRPTRRSRCGATSTRSTPSTPTARLTPEQERELIELRESCFRSEDFREGIAAFAEKRKPDWKGR